MVNNQAQTRCLPFAKRLLYSGQVTLAYRIERNSGDWQRRCRVLSAAELFPAIAKVLSLEQGQTDRLCEFSPRELLRLVFDVFGDQEVLGHYDTACEHPQQLARKMEQASHELEHTKAQLAEL